MDDDLCPISIQFNLFLLVVEVLVPEFEVPKRKRFQGRIGHKPQSQLQNIEIEV